MPLKKIGLIVLIVGIILLIFALIMIFSMKSSPWALIMLGISIVVNTVGTLCLLRKRSE